MLRRKCLALLAGAGAAPVFAAKPAGYTFRPQNGRTAVLLASKPYTGIHFAPRWSRPFLHPIVTPSGVEVSRGVPPKAGEDSEFPCQRGLWYGHGDIGGCDFWCERVEESTGKTATGRMVVSQAPEVDARAAAVTVTAALVTPDGGLLGTVAERFRFSGDDRRNLIDCAITIAAGERDLVMGNAAAGGLAIRLTEEFRDDRGVDMVNSEGASGVEVCGRPARWVDYSARIFGRMVGVAILDHPQNPRYPTRWQASDYGLISANPFGAGCLQDPEGKEPSAEGGWTIRPGSPLTLSYRVAVHEGDAEDAGIEALHAEFAGTPHAE